MRPAAAGATSSITRSAAPSSSQAIDVDAGLDLAAVLLEQRSHGVGDRPRCRPRRPASRSGGRRSPSATPIAEDIGWPSGRNACAATPANSARRLLGRPAPGQHAWPAGRAGSAEAGQRAAGARARAASAGGTRRRCRRTARPAGRRAAATARPSRAEAGRACPSTDRQAAAPRPPSSGCAYCTSGQRHRSPCPARSSSRENGVSTPERVEARALVVEQPGQRQLAAARAAAERSAASSTVTSTPAAASVRAAASPLGPLPTTTAVVTAVRHPPLPEHRAHGIACPVDHGGRRTDDHVRGERLDPGVRVGRGRIASAAWHGPRMSARSVGPGVLAQQRELVALLGLRVLEHHGAQGARTVSSKPGSARSMPSRAGEHLLGVVLLRRAGRRRRRWRRSGASRGGPPSPRRSRARPEPAQLVEGVLRSRAGGRRWRPARGVRGSARAARRGGRRRRGWCSSRAVLQVLVEVLGEVGDGHDGEESRPGPGRPRGDGETADVRGGGPDRDAERAGEQLATLRRTGPPRGTSWCSEAPVAPRTG